MPNLIDPNSTITFGKLKLNNPYSLSNPADDDFLCAFDGSEGELSKTNISAKLLKSGALRLQRYDRTSNSYDTTVPNPAQGCSAVLLTFCYVSPSGVTSKNSFNTCVYSREISSAVTTLNFFAHTYNLLIYFQV